MNNNNFNRQNIPSNMPFYNNGNPFANFQPMSTNRPQISNNNFQKSFVQPEPFIDKINYQNQNNMLHNNVGDNVMNEDIVEYKLHIDSSDRDIESFKDPFSYIVTLNPTNNSKGPTIEKEFKNIKYIKLESIILPRYQYIQDIGIDDFQLSQTSESHLYDNRFVILQIDELEDTESRCYGTNLALTKSFARVTPDKLISKSYYTGVAFTGRIYYKNSKLKNLSKLTIRLLDSTGNQIRIKEVNNGTSDIKNHDPLTATIIDPNDPKKKKEIELPKTDLRHPLNENIQNYISLTVGVVESNINTDIKYSL